MHICFTKRSDSPTFYVEFVPIGLFNVLLNSSPCYVILKITCVALDDAKDLKANKQRLSCERS